ncbi:LOW QUALITY PROTEIN: hypothetical protein HID58_018304, partial [Brassica napus]
WIPLAGTLDLPRGEIDLVVGCVFSGVSTRWRGLLRKGVGFLGFGYGRSQFPCCRFVCRRGGEGAWWIGRALSGSSSGVTYWRSLFAVEWTFLESRLGVSSRTRVVFLLRGDDGSSARTQGCLLVCGQGLFVVLRLRSLEVSASSVIYGRVCCALHDALHLLDHLTYQPGACYLASPARSSSEAQEDRARFSSSRVKPSVGAIASLFLIAVTEDPVSSLSSLQPDLLGGSECFICYRYLALDFLLSPRFGKVSVAFFKLHGQSRYKCWGDYQNLATPAMSRGVEESGIRGN